MESPRPYAPRVGLRPALPSDAALLARWRQEPSVRRYQPLGPVSVSQLRAELGTQRLAHLGGRHGEKYQWIITAEESAVGWITLLVTNWEHGLAEIGYALTTAHQRKGLMLEALHLALAEIFCSTEIERIEARCAVDNVGSIKVLERAGFTREGVLRGYFELDGVRVDNYIYALLRADYLA